MRAYAAQDKDIFILLLPPFSDRDINASQRSATVILQKSLKEGFGLTVSEAMWKSKPVIGGAVGDPYGPWGSATALDRHAFPSFADNTLHSDGPVPSDGDGSNRR